MPDVSVTATSVVKGAGVNIINGTFGATVTAGQTVYLDETTDTFKLADANASALTSVVAGIALNGGAAGQPAAVANRGLINPGFTVTVGAVYVQSANAGGIAPVADLAAGWYTSIIGVGKTASQLLLAVTNSGVAVPA